MKDKFWMTLIIGLVLYVVYSFLGAVDDSLNMKERLNQTVPVNQEEL